MIDLEAFANAMEKVAEAVAEVFQKIAEAVKKIWQALQPFIVRVALTKAGLKIVNKRGQNKLVLIYGRML